MGSFRFEQVRAIASVQRLTGLAFEQARDVVVDGRHDLYDAQRQSDSDEEETLGDEVRAAIEDHLDSGTPAGAFVVVSLLNAVGAPWWEVYGDTLELALPDDRLALTGSGHWFYLEIPVGRGEYEYWWTGIAADCPDPLLVADVLEAVVRADGPVAGRRVRSLQEVVPTCHRCGAPTVPLIYGMPDAHLMSMARLGYVATAGCVVDDTGLPDPHSGVCVRCGQQRLLTLEGDDDPAADPRFNPQRMPGDGR